MPESTSRAPARPAPDSGDRGPAAPEVAQTAFAGEGAPGARAVTSPEVAETALVNRLSVPSPQVPSPQVPGVHVPGAHVPGVSAPHGRLDSREGYDPDQSDEVELLDELLGTVLSETYHLIGVLGEGGMSRVYEASHVRVEGKRFAVKVLRVDLVGRADVARRFRREARAMVNVSHPNVIDILDLGETPDGRPYLVMEMLKGESLGDRLDREGRLPVELAAYIIRGASAGVAAAHEQRIIHRDLKPDNVFLMGDPARPKVKVLDFGLARLTELEGSELTRTGVVMGTPGYMAPEQARGEQVDYRVDIYGLGAMLYTALTGRPPYERETFQQTVLAVMTSEPPRPRSITPSIPTALELVIQRAMAREPEARFASADDLSLALEGFDSLSQAALAPGRAPHISQLALAKEASQAESARASLVMWSLGGFIALMVALVVAVSGALEVLVFHRAATGVELALIGLAIFGTLATPSLLVFGRVRRRIWGNSPEVVRWVGELKRVLVAMAVAYSLAALAVHVYVGLSWRGASMAERGLVGGWAGWHSVFFTIALLAAVAATSWTRSRGKLLRALLGPGLSALVLSLSVALLYLGYARGAAHAPSAASQLGGSESGEMTIAAAEPALAPSASGGPGPAQPVELTADATGVRFAPASELGAAKAKGLAGLLPLKERYPEDPDVLRALAMALGQDPRTYTESTVVLRQLFQLAPKDATDRQLRTLVIKIATSPGSSAESALELMSSHMGSAGPDLLYDLYLTSTALRPRLVRLLERDEVRERATPALNIAYELRSAESCQARLPLLERAKLEGDERALATLQMLSSRTQRGCGAGKRRPCPPPCGQHAKAFMATAADIRARLQHGAPTKDSDARDLDAGP
ncbi:MAG: protein kinase [Polyangiaceae bacterium]|nr:protein kinase [Polyangiaceae bacterium]MCW5790535.1 protein kinase [Polyangiaceae bacterium]